MVSARTRGYEWPGNVRELRNMVERITHLGEMALALDNPTSRWASDPFTEAARSGLPYRRARAAVLDAFADMYVDDMLNRHGGNVSHAAKAAGIARRYFQRLKEE
jgi:DNA-binding NtrC family response regulator